MIVLVIWGIVIAFIVLSFWAEYGPPDQLSVETAKSLHSEPEKWTDDDYTIKRDDGYTIWVANGALMWPHIFLTPHRGATGKFNLPGKRMVARAINFQAAWVAAGRPKTNADNRPDESSTTD